MAVSSKKKILYRSTFLFSNASVYRRLFTFCFHVVLLSMNVLTYNGCTFNMNVDDDIEDNSATSEFSTNNQVCIFVLGLSSLLVPLSFITSY